MTDPVVMSPCDEWVGYHDKDGYGWVYVKVDGKKKYRKAHRVAWEEANGPIPAGLQVLHHCDNPPCRRLSHLYLGNTRQNMIDRFHRGRPNGVTHKLTPKNVRLIRAAYQGGARQVDLAAEYGVVQTTISKVVLRITWKEVVP